MMLRARSVEMVRLYWKFILVCLSAGRNLADQQCGKIAKKSTFINQGQRVKHAWPWMGSLGYLSGEKWNHLCGASLVSSYHAVTAAHCALDPTVLKKTAEGRLLVRFGNNNISSTKTENTQKVNVQTIAVHPNYSGGFYHDLSVLTFSSQVTMSDFVNTICLPTQSTDREDLDGKGLVVTGWGNAEEKGGILYRLIVEVYNNKICNQEYQHAPVKTKNQYFPNEFTDDIFCTGDFTGTFTGSTCHGDSGGPAISFVKQVK